MSAREALLEPLAIQMWLVRKRRRRGTRAGGEGEEELPGEEELDGEVPDEIPDELPLPPAL